MQTRVLTAIALLLVLGSALFVLPRPVWWALIGVLVCLIGYEWGKLCQLSPAQAAVVGAGTAAGFVLLWAGVQLATPEIARFCLLSAFGLSTVFWLLLAPVWTRDLCVRSGIPLLVGAGLVVLPSAALAMVWLPPALLLAILGVTWMADSFAYLVGRRYGRRRLAPRISPGKTWEGLAGGMVAVLGYAIIVRMFYAEQWPWSAGVAWRSFEWALYLAVAMFLGGLSVLGDLFESALKRRAGVKDSGNWLPGHGGALDRADSALAVLPSAALIALLAGTNRAF